MIPPRFDYHAPASLQEALALLLDLRRQLGALRLRRNLAGKLDIKNADERRPIPTRKAILHSPEFQALWDRIKHKTTYRVQFDNDKLIRDCTAALTRDLHIARARLQWRKAEIGIGKAGVERRYEEVLRGEDGRSHRFRAGEVTLENPARGSG